VGILKSLGAYIFNGFFAWFWMSGFNNFVAFFSFEVFVYSDVVFFDGGKFEFSLLYQRIFMNLS
jgi:hypothetical protein